MRQKRFLMYLLIQAIVIVGVVFIFKFGSDVKSASVEAGVLFILMPAMFAWKEFQVARFERMSFYLGLAQFWLLFALPILGLRLSNWDADFAELSFLGVPGPVLHRFANSSYMTMMALTLWNYFRRPKLIY